MHATINHCRLSFLAVVFILSTVQAFSQSRSFQENVFAIDSMNTVSPREKIFIHHDKPSYQPGDTIWFKGYILSAPEHLPNDSSRLAYVEIINAQQEVIRRISTPCFMGLFSGNITLHEKHFPQGIYLLRAYTRHLQNFGDSLFFQSRFTIIDPRAETWQTTVRTLSFTDNRLLISARLTGQDRQQIANRELTIRLRAKNRVLFRTGITTDAAGNIAIDTLLKDINRDDLQLEIAEQDRLKLQLPIVSGAQGLIDLQFLPEGGAFIAGLPQRLGFKALDATGKSTDVNGMIRDSKGTSIAHFASLHKGMGIVSFTPLAGEAYTAVLDNGLSFSLPVPQGSGTCLQVVSHPAADSIKIKITATPDLYGRIAYFAATTRGIAMARGRLVLSAKGFEAVLARAPFRSGITVFTVYDELLQPINGRVVFIHHANDLQLSLVPHKEIYDKKDSVSLRLHVRNSKGEPVAGSFSMAVLDTGQVKITQDAENLVSYMLLGSDLKGEIEEPAYYCNQPDPDALEALLLTQGWISYQRKIAPVLFPYEKDFTISGRVSNVINKPLDGVKVILFGKAGNTNAFFADTLTNGVGIFTFRRFRFYETDSISMLIKALNKREKASNVGIDLHEPVYPPVTGTIRLQGIGRLLTDTAAQNHVARQAQLVAALKKDGVILQEVIVNSRLRIQGSKNLNKDGGADQVIGEEALNKTPKESLLNVLKTQVPGFHMGSPPRNNGVYYMIRSNLVRVIIDGVDLHFFYQPFSGQRNEYIQFLDTYLNYFAAEDIRAIEIMNTPRYNGAYRTEYLSIEEQLNSGPASVDVSFIEITTQTGNGPFLKKTPGMYLLKPLYPVLGRQFYSPRYTSPAQETVFPDLRQTVYWNPEVVTDANGEALVSFYTSESSSGYLVVVQGTDLAGGLGVVQMPLRVEGNKGSGKK